jgi:N-acetyl-anhydromuramyl-L-alanine amidase AmpD
MTTAAKQRLPEEWLPDCDMERIVCHWTAGAYKANATDLEHYHLLIEGDGTVVTGDHPISDNVSTGDDDYAAHTKSLNTGSIGVSLCCMGGEGVTESPFVAGPYPMTETQWRVLVEVVAELCVAYEIEVTRETVLSHAEVEGTLGVDQSGKWDYTRLAFDLEIEGALEIGDCLRGEVADRLHG